MDLILSFMTKKEYDLISSMTSDEYAKYLLKKNGRPDRKYTRKICNLELKQKSDKGYIRHHLLETKLPLLSSSRRSFLEAIEYSRRYMDIDFTDKEVENLFDEAQKAHNLVYCTKEEHILLHDKIRKECSYIEPLTKLMSDYGCLKRHYGRKYRKILNIKTYK